MIICEKCGKPKTFVSFLTGLEVPCLCDCEKRRIAEEETRRSREQQMLKAVEFRKASLLGERYANVSFMGTKIGENESFDTAFIRCSRYCDKAQEVFDKGLGIYLYGDKGTGKTHLAACIVNELNDKLFPALFTNFGEIAKIALKSPETFDKICRVNFLVIDDFGAQRVRGKDGDLWLQEKVYDVINTRYNEMLPTIFTSNYFVGDLTAQCGVAPRTVDRIAEMATAVIKLTGQSKRQALNNTECIF